MTYLTYPCAIHNREVDRQHDEIYDGVPDVTKKEAVESVLDALKHYTESAYGLSSDEVRGQLIRALGQSDPLQVDHMLITLLTYEGTDPWMIHASDVMQECARKLANDEVE